LGIERSAAAMSAGTSSPGRTLPSRDFALNSGAGARTVTSLRALTSPLPSRTETARPWRSPLSTRAPWIFGPTRPVVASHLDVDLGPLGHREAERRHRQADLLVGAVHLAARRQGANAAVDRRDRDQGAADQQRHEAFEEIDRRHGEEDQRHHDPAEMLAAATRVPDRAARLDRRVVDRLDHEGRPELLLLHRRRVLDLATAFGDGAPHRLGIATRGPLQIGALQDEEDDDEERDHAEDQCHRPLRIGIAAVSVERDQGDSDHHHDDADQPEQA
jgi:hypothetical protein